MTAKGTMTVGERMQERRKSLGLSQQDVADHVGVGRSQVSVWENDGAFPGGANLIELAEILRVTTAWFNDEGGEPEDYESEELDAPLVVRESGGAYGRRVTPVDIEGHPVMNDVELILSWVPERMSARWTGEISVVDRLAEVYAYGSRSGWSADRLDFVHKTRHRVEALQ